MILSSDKTAHKPKVSEADPRFHKSEFVTPGRWGLWTLPFDCKQQKVDVLDLFDFVWGRTRPAPLWPTKTSHGQPALDNYGWAPNIRVCWVPLGSRGARMGSCGLLKGFGRASNGFCPPLLTKEPPKCPM